MFVCPGSSAADLDSTCVRVFWSTLLPAVFVSLFCIAKIPLPKWFTKLIEPLTSQFTRFLTLEQAEALDAAAAAADEDGAKTSNLHKHVSPKLWKVLVLSWIALLELLTWTVIGAFNLVLNEGSAVYTVHPFITASVWLYATLRPVLRLRPTPPYDLFTLFFVLFGVEVLSFGGIIYDSRVSGISLPPAIIIVGHVTNFVALLALLATIFSMPVGIPGRGVDVQQIGKSISPEDYTTLWGWATFHWVWPLIKRGTHETLNEDDVWNLSPCFQSRPVFIQFTRTKRATLLRKLWAANSLDIILDFILSFVSVVFNYASPFFLKRILDAIAYPTPENRSQAFIFAFLAFGCTIIKAQADVQHLWIGRRAASRTRSELMAAIYDKALKRKDFSGIVDKDKAPTGTQTKEEAAKADDPKAGADVGKIVNLMAGDANRCSMMLSAIYMLYSAPFEIIIGSVFLYNLLGWSAFAGFFVLVLMWPLNSYITKRSIRIQKGVMAARDKRMGVLNELIGAVKFIKFFAWEDRWIARALDARAFEMKWMVKSRLNSVMFSMVWSCAPVLVSVISFLVFVMQGNELTVSIAFTAIALFNMIRTPLNIVPTFLVQVLQTGVALNRIAVYLDEDEVDEQVSSLKKKNAGPHASEDDPVKGFGIENGTFKWNEVEEKAADKKEDGKKPANGSESTTPTVVENDEADRSSVSIGEAGDHRFELKDITVLFPERQLSLITGPTASGKSALLMALLGELTTLSGRIIMSKDLSRVDEHGLTHSIAYSAQSSWLRHQSIKDNILFGSPYDEDRYNAVIECCALQPDLQVLEDGDATEIGARGVSLSGGQKARVALARAVYSSAKYVLLDDPLSAVDSHTARFLFEKLLQGPLLQHRTVVLVTHHVELVLPGAHYLVRMLDGRIDTQGTVAELRARGVLEEITQEEEVKVHEEEQVAAKEEPTAEEVAAEVTSEEAKPNVKDKKPRKLIKDEHRQEGGVKWSVYNTYLKASSYWTWGILATFIVIYQFLGIGEKLWIKYWGEAYGTDAPNATYFFTSFSALEQEVLMDGPMASHHLTKAIHGMSSYSTLDLPFSLPPAQERPLFYISVYAAIGLSSALVGILSSLTQYTGALRASRVLFKRLLESVVRATMRWHDTTPQGRMLNRFSKDIETVDSSLASSLQNVNTSLATFAASVITVSVIFPWFLVPAFFIGMGYRVLAIGYLNTGRDLRRMESNTRSPIFSGFGELLEGIVTVRAFSAEQRFLDGLHKKIDLTTKMWYSFWMTNRWLLLNFDFLGACSILVTTLFALSSVIGAGLAGLCITSAMAFTNSIYWCCRFWTALELDLNSVERVVEYLDLPQEPPAVIESCRPPAYWPSSESPNLIVVEDLVIKYAPELPPVLHNVSFSLKARERVGLLGRTGSGKSTLAMSILRFTDPASGRILIDGIDISTIGVQDLRSRLTFIPQEATLFSGTLRDNLDPFQEHEDSECLDVLYRVHLINESESQRESRQASRAASRAATRPSSPSQGQDSPSPTAASSAAPSMTDVESKAPITLDTKVSAGGVNFSQGQRQLIAMARALLRHSSIIVLDEATSSIDFATDAKIQTTIREEFVGSLLLTVAHRLKTVIDYDRLIVLDKGVVAEFDTPWNLIQKEDGIFRNMCLKSGMFAELEQAAKEQAAKVASS